MVWSDLKVMKDKKFFSYLVRCSDDSLYAGFTTDLDHRMQTHNAGKGAKYTRSRLPVELVYYEEFSSKEEAMRREAALKKLTRKEKLKLIEEGSNKKEG